MNKKNTWLHNTYQLITMVNACVEPSKYFWKNYAAMVQNIRRILQTTLQLWTKSFQSPSLVAYNGEKCFLRKWIWRTRPKFRHRTFILFSTTCECIQICSIRIDLMYNFNQKFHTDSSYSDPHTYLIKSVMGNVYNSGQ